VSRMFITRKKKNVVLFLQYDLFYHHWKRNNNSTFIICFKAEKYLDVEYKKNFQIGFIIEKFFGIYFILSKDFFAIPEYWLSKKDRFILSPKNKWNTLADLTLRL